MKKLLLSILTLTSLSVFAQKDVRVMLLEPEEGQEINSGKPFVLGFNIKNVGVDTIMALDSFAIVPFIYIPGSTPQQLQPLFGGVRIAPGDSITLGPANPYVVTFSSDLGQALFCVNLSFKDTALDVNDTNNLDCHEISLIENHTGISELIAGSVKAYPNPASSVFTLTMNATNITVDIMDITGKMVETAPVTMGEARFDVSNYKNGVYFYQVKGEDNSVIKSGKFTVSH